MNPPGRERLTVTVCEGCGEQVTGITGHVGRHPESAAEHDVEYVRGDLYQAAEDLAERYGEAIVAISAALPNVNRVRAIIAGLE